MKPRTRRWLFWPLFVLAALAAAYCVTDPWPEFALSDRTWSVEVERAILTKIRDVPLESATVHLGAPLLAEDVDNAFPRIHGREYLPEAYPVSKDQLEAVKSALLKELELRPVPPPGRVYFKGCAFFANYGVELRMAGDPNPVWLALCYGCQDVELTYMSKGYLLEIVSSPPSPGLREMLSAVAGSEEPLAVTSPRN